MSESSFASEAEWAAKLGVSRNTLYRARKSRELAFYRIGSRVVISDEQVAAFLSRRVTSGKGR
jgi:excisionase family DNA binding protein